MNISIASTAGVPGVVVAAKASSGELLRYSGRAAFPAHAILDAYVYDGSIVLLLEGPDGDQLAILRATDLKECRWMHVGNPSRSESGRYVAALITWPRFSMTNLVRYTVVLLDVDGACERDSPRQGEALQAYRLDRAEPDTTYEKRRHVLLADPNGRVFFWQSPTEVLFAERLEGVVVVHRLRMGRGVSHSVANTAEAESLRELPAGKHKAFLESKKTYTLSALGSDRLGYFIVLSEIDRAQGIRLRIPADHFK